MKKLSYTELQSINVGANACSKSMFWLGLGAGALYSNPAVGAIAAAGGPAAWALYGTGLAVGGVIGAVDTWGC